MVTLAPGASAGVVTTGAATRKTCMVFMGTILGCEKRFVNVYSLDTLHE
jgi:hypothetical protein